MDRNLSRLLTLLVVAAASIIGSSLSAAELTVNAIQNDLSEKLRVTQNGGIELTRPGGGLIGIPKAMISGVVIGSSRAFIQTQPFSLMTPEDDKPNLRVEPITVVIMFDIGQRDEIIHKLRPLY